MNENVGSVGCYLFNSNITDSCNTYCPYSGELCKNAIIGGGCEKNFDNLIECRMYYEEKALPSGTNGEKEEE